MNFDNASSVYFNNKEVSSIVCLDNNKIIYTKTNDDVPIQLYDNIRHVFVIPIYDTRIDAENDGNYYVSEFDGIYNEGDSISDIEEDIETLTDSYGDYFIFSASYMKMELEEFYDYEYTGDYDLIFDYGNYGFYYNGYDIDLGALIFTQSLSQANGVLLFFTDNGTTLDCSISNDDSNQVTVFTWTI